MRILLILLILLSFGCADRKPCTCLVDVGMTKGQVLEKCGSPNDIHRIKSASGVTEQWIYYHWNPWVGYCPDIARYYVYIRNGIVTSLQD